MKKYLVHAFVTILCVLLISELASAQMYYFTDEFFKKNFGSTDLTVKKAQLDGGVVYYVDSLAFNKRFGPATISPTVEAPEEGGPEVVIIPLEEDNLTNITILEPPGTNVTVANVTVEVIPVEIPEEGPEMGPIEEEEIPATIAPVPQVIAAEGEEAPENETPTNETGATGGVIRGNSTQIALIGLLIVIIIVMLIILLTRGEEGEEKKEEDWEEGEFFKEVEEKKEKPKTKKEEKKREEKKEEKPKEEKKREEKKEDKPFLLRIKEEE